MLFRSEVPPIGNLVFEFGNAAHPGRKAIFDALKIVRQKVATVRLATDADQVFATIFRPVSLRISPSRSSSFIRRPTR
ncbi:MAG TPA: hypothetical protein VK638_11965 [Edaphobacter sp.]|nr:hypothetical protein [Edaphobacter sp.]